MPTTVGDAKLLDCVYCVPDVSQVRRVSQSEVNHARTHARTQSRAIARKRNRARSQQQRHPAPTQSPRPLTSHAAAGTRLDSPTHHQANEGTNEGTKARTNERTVVVVMTASERTNERSID